MGFFSRVGPFKLWFTKEGLKTSWGKAWGKPKRVAIKMPPKPRRRPKRR